MESDLRRWMRLIEGMSYAEALDIFKRAGINADAMTANQLRTARNKTAPRLHPDTGGSDEAMQNFNAAYDVLKDQASQGIKRDPATAKPFDMGSFFDDDKPNPMESIHVNCFPIDRPTIEVKWYSWHQTIAKSEAERLLAVKAGATIDLDASERNQSYPDRPPHRARATRTADQIVFQYTHHSTRGGDIWTAEWSAPTYALPIAELAKAYQELLRAPAKAAKIRAHNKAANLSGGPYWTE